MFDAKPRNLADFAAAAIMTMALMVVWCLLHLANYIDTDQALLRGGVGEFTTQINATRWGYVFFVFILPVTILVQVVRNFSPFKVLVFGAVCLLAYMYHIVFPWDSSYHLMNQPQIIEASKTKSSYIAPLFFYSNLVFWVAGGAVLAVFSIVSKFCREVAGNLAIFWFSVIEAVLFLVDTQTGTVWDEYIQFVWIGVFLLPFWGWVKVLRAVYNTPTQQDVQLAHMKELWDERYQFNLGKSLDDDEAKAKAETEAQMGARPTSLDVGVFSKVYADLLKAAAAKAQTAKEALVEEEEAKAETTKPQKKGLIRLLIGLVRGTQPVKEKLVK